MHEDYDCTLNQTNIGNNNNKFYIMQLLQDGQHFTCWNRWGRVVSAPPALHILPRVPKRPQLLSGGGTPNCPGALSTGPGPTHRPANVDGGHTPEGCRFQGEVGQSKINHFTRLEDAKKDFEKKFREKTKNKWAERDRFVAHPGKYTLIEVQGEDEAQEAVVKVRWPGKVGGPWAEGLVGESPLVGLCHCPAVQPQPQNSPLASGWPVSVWCHTLPSCSCPHVPSIFRWMEAQ